MINRGFVSVHVIVPVSVILLQSQIGVFNVGNCVYVIVPVRSRVCVIDRVLVSVNVAVSVILLYSRCKCKSCVCNRSFVSVG